MISHGLCHLASLLAADPRHRTKQTPASWNPPLLRKACHSGFAQRQAAGTHPNLAALPREYLTSSCIAGNLRGLLTSQLHPVMPREAKWPQEVVAVTPPLVLTTHAISRKHLCLHFFFPFCSAVTAAAMLMLLDFLSFTNPMEVSSFLPQHSCHPVSA